MSVKHWKSAAGLTAAIALALVAVGCSSNPPCETDLTVVDGARGAATAAEAKLNDAKNTQADLQKKIDAEQARAQELEQRKAELLGQLEELEN